MTTKKKNKNKSASTKARYLAHAPGTKQHRKEFIETSAYINGVRDYNAKGERKGEQVIRALTKEEKEWLANFNAAYEHGVREAGENLGVKDWTEIDHRDYARKMDLMFMTRKDGKLIAYDLHELDRVTSEMEKDIDAENLQLEFKPRKEK